MLDLWKECWSVHDILLMLRWSFNLPSMHVYQTHKSVCNRPKTWNGCILVTVDLMAFDTQIITCEKSIIEGGNYSSFSCVNLSASINTSLRALSCKCCLCCVILSCTFIINFNQVMYQATLNFLIFTEIIWSYDTWCYDIWHMLYVG